ncbi:MAG TPA: uroporphyrinogen decarboxylase family protein [Bacteroidales bacterium]|nr:uroporphyrinogen decarboxylase family protein [Bacteroidales bacterium]
MNFTRKYDPDFNQLVKVFNREVPDRPVLFEYFMNGDLFSLVTGRPFTSLTEKEDMVSDIIESFYKLGYDYATIPARYLDTFSFESSDHERKETVSLNTGSVIHNRESFNAYPWPDAEKCNYQILNKISGMLPDGMKITIAGPGGLLEDVIYLTGYEKLCFMIYEDEQLTQDIFDAVGSRLLRFYEITSAFYPVGALIVNDDWGFKSQTLFSPETLRQYVFPWQKKIVEAIHKNGKYAVLHSCGQISAVIEDIITDMNFDAKHSFEDTIIPVETAYEQWSDMIAIVGGIDMDFLVRKTPDEIRKRAERLLTLTGSKGYALGSGNSIPPYVPVENYLAMISVI